jgi:hypothetical protein
MPLLLLLLLGVQRVGFWVGIARIFACFSFMFLLKAFKTCFKARIIVYFQ